MEESVYARIQFYLLIVTEILFFEKKKLYNFSSYEPNVILNLIDHILDLNGLFLFYNLFIDLQYLLIFRITHAYY